MFRSFSLLVGFKSLYLWEVKITDHFLTISDVGLCRMWLWKCVDLARRRMRWVDAKERGGVSNLFQYNAIRRYRNVMPFSFLDAPSHLCMRLCPSVRPSVCLVLFSKVKRTHTRRNLCRVSGLVLVNSSTNCPERFYKKPDVKLTWLADLSDCRSVLTSTSY